ncbi:hypothetical protein CcaverHIS002_0703140 [Cutaneotrichosporon cavernicola]|uniref:YbaK/aminoacyl-tRNA synthetase-associated domain-containing protein n=1 Tax=Cutaneotrichosporon cavernicola TaxID=279322 RepID=A0AA48QYU8_9TREE|nr:uncharacterized protein CcaverHIS019_0703220 [Cutaneotrichosporon cavernicola]BEI86968.1 hypothetical protein CcaverHIS002_0703140 [Cutaneotrichosporon cavernicola]BEI94741.1 hypothetical protein CcaverHIS019_0703220 [Cutaneotrichosporon cavernicola]BEJ02516.1 hypothetical protein CcaverHIS631_0703110 [Cutaneotrichosporon cavernicola]BEJ10274.1 hypothetical protein CcaverHIS641_0703090 [Cutaneotrichosporon cavernicola]
MAAPLPSAVQLVASSTPSTTGTTPLPSGATTPTPCEPPEMVLSRDAVRRVAAALTAAGHAGAIRILPVTGNTAATAAAALNCSTGAIANSLIFTGGDKKPLLVLTSGGHRVDTRALGERLGWSKSAIKRAKPEVVKSATGFSIGGVAPVGFPQPIRTIVDEELGKYPENWAAAGHHQAVFAIAFEKLVEITGGEVMKVD